MTDVSTFKTLIERRQHFARIEALSLLATRRRRELDDALRMFLVDGADPVVLDDGTKVELVAGAVVVMPPPPKAGPVHVVILADARRKKHAPPPPKVGPVQVVTLADRRRKKHAHA